MEFAEKYGLNNQIAEKWGVPVVSKNDDDYKREEARSEHDYTESKVKRDNLIQVFLKGTEVDKYIAENLYGK